MDPFTAITGAAGLISTVQGILNELKPYYKGWKDCPQELTELRNELKDLKTLLRNIQPGVIRLNTSDSINRNAVQPQAIVDLLRLVEETKKLLEPYQGPEKIDQVYEKPDKKRRLRWKSTKEEVQSLKRRIATCLEGLGLAIAADTSSGVIDANEKLQTIEEARIEEAAKARQKEILDWISPEDPGARHNEVRALRGEGTGGWFYNTDQFTSWYGNKDSSCNWLWCRGNPGTGKTFIIYLAHAPFQDVTQYFKPQARVRNWSNIVDHISDRFKGENFGIAYAYCNYGDVDTQNPVRIFGSILRQIGGLKKRILPQIEALHKTLSPTSRKPTLQELLEVLKAVLKEFARVWFFFDALDECSEDHRRTILSSLKDLTVPGIQFFATSRPYVDMSSAKGAKVLDISANREDIEAFIRKKATTYDLEEEFISEIIEKVIEKSDGMFLLAKYQTDHIFRGRNPKKMKANFDTMPKDIGQFFADAMGRIAKQDDSDKKLALNALMWISKATRPLHIDELSVALAFGEGDHTAGDMYDRSDVENACLGLVIVDEATGVCRLAHYTVQEYLIGLPEFVQQANLLLARTCLRYITLEAFEEDTGFVDDWLGVRIEEYKLYDYAVRNWAIHMRSSGEEQDLITMVDKAFRNGKAIESAMKVIMSDIYYQAPYKTAVFFGRLHTAAYWGLSKYAQHILSDTKDVNLSDMYSRTPLSWAAENGHEAVVKLLVGTEGVDVNSKGEYGRSPLSLAAQRGHEAVVKLLVGTEGVDVNSKDEYGRSPLSWAAGNGNEAVVKLLVGTEGVDVDFKDTSCGQTPLSWAAENGHEAVVKLLVGTEGVDVNSKDEYGRSPLSWAAQRGHEAVAKLLVGTEGVDVNSKDEYGRSPLSWAARRGHEAVAKLLVGTEGVDVDFKDTLCGQTPLSWAAEDGNEAVVKFLVGTEGVDVDSKDNNGRSPLSWAAGNGHEAVVKSLVGTKGVDVDSKSKDGQSPLSWAAEDGNEAVVKFLVGTEGVDVDSKDNNGRSPLSWAAGNGHEAVVKSLVGTKGVDVDSKSKDGQSPLSWAAKNGHGRVVKLFAWSSKADIDMDIALWPESEHSNLAAIKTTEDAKDKTELPREFQPSQPTQREVLLDTVAMHPTAALLPGPLLQLPSTLVLIPPFFYPAIFRGKYFTLIFWITSCFSLLLLFFFFY